MIWFFCLWKTWRQREKILHDFPSCSTQKSPQKGCRGLVAMLKNITLLKQINAISLSREREIAFICLSSVMFFNIATSPLQPFWGLFCVLQDGKSCNIFSRCLQVFHRQKNQIIPLLIDSLIISWLVTWLYLDYRVSKFQYLCGFSVLKVIDFFRKGHRLLPQRS